MILLKFQRFLQFFAPLLALAAMSGAPVAATPQDNQPASPELLQDVERTIDMMEECLKDEDGALSAEDAALIAKLKELRDSDRIKGWNGDKYNSGTHGKTEAGKIHIKTDEMEARNSQGDTMLAIIHETIHAANADTAGKGYDPTSNKDKKPAGALGHATVAGRAQAIACKINCCARAAAEESEGPGGTAETSYAPPISDFSLWMACSKRRELLLVYWVDQYDYEQWKPWNLAIYWWCECSDMCKDCCLKDTDAECEEAAAAKEECPEHYE